MSLCLFCAYLSLGVVDFFCTLYTLYVWKYTIVSSYSEQDVSEVCALPSTSVPEF